MKLFSALHVRRLLRYVGLSLTILVVILAAAIVATLTIDLGPGVRRLAEREGSTRLGRPIHLGRLSIKLFRGQFGVGDLQIDGRSPGDQPFFTAREISFGLDWSTLTSREITIATVEMTDWRMNVEKWEDGNNFPKTTNASTGSSGPRRIRTTLKYLRAHRGEFVYSDHEKPWSIVCRNLDIVITNVPRYNGTAEFSGGTVQIQDYEPMWVNMRARYDINGSQVHLDRIDFDTDGARSEATGDVDFDHWPEMTYQVKSRVDFHRMREIFFGRESFTSSGQGDFLGEFHLYKGGHVLSGTFTSDLAGVNDYRFPSLSGSLRWTPAAFDIWDASSRFFGGNARFTYSIKPLGSPERPTARFEAWYENVDLASFSDFERLPGLRVGGRATGHNLLVYPLGQFAQRQYDGRIRIAPPPGALPMTASLASIRETDRENARYEWGPFAPVPLAAHLPIAGEITYRLGPTDVEIAASHLASEKTYVAFQGSTSSTGDGSRFVFHVSSADWQESDQVLAGILTDFGSRTGAVAFGGWGEFDGEMTGRLRRPRVEGDFSGENMRAWDTVWGSGTAHLVVQNGYIDVTDGIVRQADSEIRTDGRFSLGYPRDDRGEEINARFRVARRNLTSLRHAFQLDDWPVTGRLSGEFHLTGSYTHPIGFGGMGVDNGTAWGEPFDRATASLRFESPGIRLDGAEIAKSGGTITGAAFVGWDSTYSFSAVGQRISAERVAMLANPRAPLSGLVEFSAGGSSTFDQPKYDVRIRAQDLLIGGEGIGHVTGTLALRGRELTGDLEAASPRLAITGTGRIALTTQADSEITLRFHDSSLDPYVRLFVPRLSPYTTAVATGTIRVVGELADMNHLLVDATVDRVDLRLFDYALRNAGPIKIVLDKNQVKIDRLEIVGEDTRLDVSGTVGLSDEKIAIAAVGNANLGVLQGFFKDVRGSGRAEVTAAINGPLREPVFSGSASIVNGRIRHFSIPNSLEGINGTIRFDARGVHLDDVVATLGGGQVQFAGRIGLDGYLPGDLNISARGEDLHLRYPEGVRSSIDADLTLRGNVKTPTLGGTVTVRNAVWTKRIEAPVSILELTRRASSRPAGVSEPTPPALPLKLDLRVLVPSTFRVEDNIARLVASADLLMRGTYDRPVVFGHADIDRGEVTFEGRRYRLTRGAVDFTNPAKTEPFFDVEAETNVRVPKQTYRVVVSAAGTPDRLQPSLSSDPPLPTADVLALLFGNVSTTADPELRALRPGTSTQTQTDVLTTRATQALASPISSEVGRVVEQTFGVDTFQLSPSLFDPYGLQAGRVNPSARLTIGKRISNRVYLTFSRSLNVPQYDQIILLEYDANDRLSWILSRNEDQTYALEFRVRRTF